LTREYAAKSFSSFNKTPMGQVMWPRHQEAIPVEATRRSLSRETTPGTLATSKQVSGP
jgi:hypothetical protein